MPLREPSRSFLKELREHQTTARLDNVREELAAETLLLCCPRSGHIEEDWIDALQVDALGVPANIHVARFVLRRDKAPVNPHPPAADACEQIKGVSQAIE